MSGNWGQLSSFRATGEAVVDAIGQRIRTENRIKRGGTVSPIYGDAMIDLAVRHEKELRKMLLEQYNQTVPAHVRAWARNVPGFASGESFPRLLSLLGHPRIATPYKWVEGDRHVRVLVPDGEPFERTLRQLWQYAGCGDPEVVPAKNMSQAELMACGKRTVIRPILFTFSTYLVMQHKRFESVAASRYWKVFEQAKREAAGKIHQRQCQNRKRPPLRSNGCGTVAHPEWGAPGSPWRPGHCDMHAHRIVAKEFLRDLYNVCEE
jgi:hypothetical protein